MPFKDKSKQREYFKEYKKRNHDLLLQKSRENYRLNHDKPKFWTGQNTDKRICLNCNGDAYKKPIEGCEEIKHYEYWEMRKKINNRLRNVKRKIDPYYSSGYTKDEWREKGRLKYRTIKSDIINKLGGKCCICGFDNFKALQIDHIICGNGLKERKEYGWKFLININALELIELNKIYQCLCSNCHSIKNYNERYKRIETEKIAKKESKRMEIS